MNIGITFDLRDEYLAMGYSEVETAEFDRRDTIEAIEAALQRLGHRTDRIGHAKNLVGRLHAGHRWDVVFNIAEGLRGYGREALVPALLDAYDIPYTFSDPLVLSLTLHKGMTKRVVRDAGIPTADFIVVENTAQAHGVPFPPPFFVKPVAEGTGKGVSAQSIVRRRRDLPERCAALLSDHRQPVLVETFLGGREFTVGLVGTGDHAVALGTMEVCLLADSEPEVYSYGNKENSETRVAYRLVHATDDAAVQAVERIALAAWRLLACRDAGRIDIRCDSDGRPYFLEVNPLAGLHPEHSDLPIICNLLGMPYTDLIAKILASASVRVERSAASDSMRSRLRQSPPAVRDPLEAPAGMHAGDRQAAQ